MTSSSRNAASAFKLLAWLAQADTSSQLARAGGRMLPARKSLVTSPSWYRPDVPADQRVATGETLQRLLSAQRSLLVPRIPGVDAYMAALGEAVKRFLGGEALPEESLQQAATRWDDITDAHGRQSQREAYLKHLGISD